MPGGNYWFTAYTFRDLNAPRDYTKVDVFVGKIPSPDNLSPGTANIQPQYFHIDISDPTLQIGYTNFMSSVFSFFVNGPSIAAANGGFQDMDFNPADGKLYSYVAFPNALTPVSSPYPEPPLNSYLVRIDPSSTPGYWGKATVINATANTVPNREEDGAYFDATGNLYTLFTDGTYAQVNTTDGTLGTLTPTNLPISTDTNMRGDLATNSPVVPLPLKLLSFRGNSDDNKVQLYWEFAGTEAYGETAIERSTDGRSFAQIGSVKQTSAQGTFNDNAPAATAYYRLRLDGGDGQAAYSNTLRFAGGRLMASTTAYPNPAAATITIQSPCAVLDIQLHDVTGRLLASGSYSVTGGIVTLSLTNIAKGTFVLTARNAATGEQLLSRVMQKL